MIPNLRDVGETINILYGENIMKKGILYRGGTVNELFDKYELPPVNCILNLRNGNDKVFDGIKQIHVPRTYTHEVYETRNGNVRQWLNQALKSVCDAENYPLLVHCTGGKDRTGVFVALVLSAIGTKPEFIVDDYLLSEGETDINLIKLALGNL